MGLTLVVLAAGIGSRYGGLKQIDPVGPSGEIVIDYSIHDALHAGFDKVVCVIRHAIEKDFKECIASHFEKHIPVEYVYQEIDTLLPKGFTIPPDRRKPWGTGHAILVCRDHVREPFAVINADDFYGRASYQILADGLRQLKDDPRCAHFCMVGFPLNNTLSEHGSVARGICTVTDKHLLSAVVEHTRIEKAGAGARTIDDSGKATPLSGQELVSLNMWGFTPALFPALEQQFAEFLDKRGKDIKAEFFIPTVVDQLIAQKRADVRVFETPEHWFGVTYPQDKPLVIDSIRKKIEAGVYPSRLWT